MMKAAWCKYELRFRFTAITSRESMNRKNTYFIKIWSSDHPATIGLGEAGLFRGLSCDDRPGYEEKLAEVCRDIDIYAANPSLLSDWPSIRFAVETAVADLSNGGKHIIFPSDWTSGEKGISINGLIWMGDRETMHRRITAKLAEGWNCIKVKIGGISFTDELELLDFIRREAPDVTLRLDANGAFTPDNALERLEQLSRFNIHSIEQPIRAGQWEAMHRICRNSPIPIALDEELIGLNSLREKQEMLDAVRPQFIVLKPTLCGGIGGSDEWLRLAVEHGIGLWITSALESNIGLNAIAQWTASINVQGAQGLGTGLLYENNISSPMRISGDKLYYNPTSDWGEIDGEWNEY